ncbi:hypothetical protein RUND412_002462 [Rhizina undulata]
MVNSPQHDPPSHNERASSEAIYAQEQPEGRTMYRRDSNLSTVSFLSDVEMAQTEVFAGPVSESLASSVTSFQHRRRARAESDASWSFYRPEPNEDLEAERENEFVLEIEGDEDGYASSVADLEGDDLEPLRRKSSSQPGSAEDPLLEHRESMTVYRDSNRTTQKIYILTEDLTIVVAGFTTSRLGYGIYIAISILTLGIGWLFLRWLPRWRIRLIGKPTILRECSWVVIENQWNELSIHTIQRRSYGQSLSTVFGVHEKAPASLDPDEDDDPVIPHLRYLDYRYIRFCYHPLLDKFVLNNSWKDPNWIDVMEIRSGIDGDEKDYRSLVFGQNVIDIEEKTVMELLMDEAFHPFYMFQIASLILWSLDNYYYYAACIFIISVFSIASTLIETRATMRRLREISRFVCDVRVLRNGFWRYVSSSDLVPGDVYEVTDPSLSLFPCDSLLLSGDCIVNESMLTGESVPVSKVPCTNESLRLLNLAASSMLPELSRHFLFCGTKIIRARRPQDGVDEEAVALAMVVRTGFNTTKGALVRSMLFPKPSGFKFYRDSFYYIAVMGVIAACGFVVSFINFVHLGLAWHLIIIRALDLITIVVPPALPATLSIGTNFALARLKRKEIFCISPQRVNVGGKLDIVCFDKTGTLTEDGLDVLGVRVVDKGSNKFTGIFKDASSLLPETSNESDSTESYDACKAVLYTMTTCHSLRLVDGELLGDPLDLKMFESTGWTYEEGGRKKSQTNGMDESNGYDHSMTNGISPPIVRPPAQKGLYINGALQEDFTVQNGTFELGIFKSFEFVSQLRRSSVIVKQFRASGGDIYVKGAPECMKEICRAQSFPENYDEILAYYTHRGYRVIACATKHIPNLSWIKAQKMKRADAESGLDFAGFIIFENKLKPQTSGVILELKQAAIRKAMCTGDNILTAISVARECRLVEKGAHVFVPHFVEGDRHSPYAKIRWESVDNRLLVLDENTLMPLPVPPEVDVSGPYDISNLRDYSMAVSGEVFRWIVDYAPADVLHRMLVRGQIFARMSPDEKHELVEKLQSIDYCVGFCGDGANDCGALKAADVGISLSEAEASVAAPFTSRVFDISCVPEIIREGRAALVTSFSCFKYMSLYSAIQFTTVSILYKSASNLGDFQFLYIDLFLILPIAVFMGWSGPYPILAAKRPTASLVSRKVLVPLLGQIAIVFALQFIAYKLVQEQSWYIPPEVHTDKPDISNSPNTALFMVSCYQYILAGIVLSVGPPYRQAMRHNVPFVITIILALLSATYILASPATWLYHLMQLTYLSTSFKYTIVAISIAGFILSMIGEGYIFPKLAKIFGGIKITLGEKGHRKRKLYKRLEDQMRI